MNETSFFDVHKTFVRGVTARDIANPLASFDGDYDAGQARQALEESNLEVAGVRKKGFVAGYILKNDLGEGRCGDYILPFRDELILSDGAPLTELILALNKFPFVFIRILGQVGGITTRGDLHDPPVRMWLFGMITAFEIRLLNLIKERFPDGGWEEYLSPARVGKAYELQSERHRRGQTVGLMECLQFADKAQIAVRDEALRTVLGIESRRRGDQVIKNLGQLRNNLAHSQDIALLDWETIVELSQNLERFMERGIGRNISMNSGDIERPKDEHDV